MSKKTPNLWNPRYFVLNNEYLYYYKNQKNKVLLLKSFLIFF